MTRTPASAFKYGRWEQFLTFKPLNKLNARLERSLPEMRVFLRTDCDTRFIRLTPLTQLAGFAGTTILAGWMIVSSSIVLMDSIGSGNLKDQASRDLVLFENRVNELATERDARASEASAAQSRFNVALDQISMMQSELLASEERVRELDIGLEVVQATLRSALKERDTARKVQSTLEAQADLSDAPIGTPSVSEAAGTTVDVLATALAETARERDAMSAIAGQAEHTAQTLRGVLRLIE
jgi:hypothetical protein